MPKDNRYSRKSAVRELVRGRLADGNADVNTGTVFVRPAAVAELADFVGLDTEFHGSWQLINGGAAGGVERELLDAGLSFSPAVAMEASAFGCDSKVLDRAVRRLLENAAANSLDSVEIRDLRRHQDSGLDYVTILALGRTLVRELPSKPVGQPVSSNAWHLEEWVGPGSWTRGKK